MQKAVVKMKLPTWRDRLQDVIQKDGRSEREIAKAAGFGHGYLHGLLHEGKTPSFIRLQKLCTALNVSMGYISDGYEISAVTERLLRAFALLPEEKQAAWLALLEDQDRQPQ